MGQIANRMAAELLNKLKNRINDKEFEKQKNANPKNDNNQKENLKKQTKA